MQQSSLHSHETTVSTIEANCFSTVNDEDYSPAYLENVQYSIKDAIKKYD